ncbi:MAG: hypothetical protein K0Q94_4251 [Paenibacillus sp.]|nr:hypothetical protein [Paenibacillus sp.]
MTQYLIVNADDFGLSVRVNEGILEAHRNGIVTSTTLMANMPGFNHAVYMANRTSSLGVGLHLNLSSGKPLSPIESVPSLVGADGCFSDKRSGWRDEDIERELDKQFNRLVSAGVMPTHLDSHHHIHLEVPAVYDIMVKLAIKKRIPVRLHPWSPYTESGLVGTDSLIMDTYDQDDGAERLLAHLQDLTAGTTELMCHPGYADSEARSSIAAQMKREAELRTFTDRRIMEAIRQSSIRLIDFRNLPVTDNSPIRGESDVSLNSHPHLSEAIEPAPDPSGGRKLNKRKPFFKRRKKGIIRKKRSTRAKINRTSRLAVKKRRRKTRSR